MSDRLDDFADAAVHDAEQDIDALRVPEFAGVLARAGRIDPGQAEPTAASDDDPLSGTRLRPDDRRVLHPFVRDATRHAEHDIDAHMRDGLPGMPMVPGASPPTSRRTRGVAWLIVVGAAALAAAIVVLVMRPVGWRGDRTTPSEGPSAAPSEGPAGPARTAPSPSPTSDLPGPPVLPAQAATPEASSAPPLGPAPRRVAPVPGSIGQDAPREPLADRLQRMDALAAEQLGNGETAAADATLAELIEVGGKDRLVELAFGDRFTIAHRADDSRRQVALWRAYLERFPSGRLADDARAGLCRHASVDTAPACWTAYLRDFPRGAYSDLARRELPWAGSDAP